MSFIGELFVNSIKILIYLIGMIVVGGLILEFLKRISTKYMFWSLGHFGIYSTAWIGTPVHELGHAIMCIIFGHRLKEVKLLKFNEDGALGHVSHSYNPNSIYQKIGNFFIGIAPILSGSGVILILMRILLPNEFAKMGEIIETFYNKMLVSPELMPIWDLIKDIFCTMFSPENKTSVKFWIFMYIVISISSHMALSPSDMRGAASGLLLIYIIVFIANLLMNIPFLRISSLATPIMVYNSYMAFALIMSIFCSVCSAALSLVLYGIKTAISS